MLLIFKKQNCRIFKMAADVLFPYLAFIVSGTSCTIQSSFSLDPRNFCCSRKVLCLAWKKRAKQKARWEGKVRIRRFSTRGVLGPTFQNGPWGEELYVLMYWIFLLLHFCQLFHSKRCCSAIISNVWPMIEATWRCSIVEKIQSIYLSLSTWCWRTLSTWSWRSSSWRVACTRWRSPTGRRRSGASCCAWCRPLDAWEKASISLTH